MTLQTKDSQLDVISDIIKRSKTIVILAGAGLSQEVGIPTYWAGEDAKYGGGETRHGYTPLQHADASLWMRDTYAQIEHFNEVREQLSSIDFMNSIYGTLLSKVREKDYFCVTSNVDSGFYQAGFDPERIYEIHGSHRGCQCVMDATHGIYPSSNEGTRTCGVCSMPTRPNILFFNDEEFNPEVLLKQQDKFHQFLDRTETEKEGVAILELGVGTTVPRVRQTGNRLYRDYQIADYIHVNLEPEPEFLFGEACAFENKEHWLQMSASEFIESL